VIDNQVDQTTGTVKVKAEFPNADLQLWPGQFVNIKVLIDTMRQVVVVPTAAVQRGPNGTFVYIVKPDNTVTVRQIAVRQQDDLDAVIARGVDAPENVVTTGFARLTEGTKVEVSSAVDAGQIQGGDRSRREGGRGKGSGKGNGVPTPPAAPATPVAPTSRATPTPGRATPLGAPETTGQTPAPGTETSGSQTAGTEATGPQTTRGAPSTTP
jgi:multidrug efflux system membrane fusion protein